MNRTTTSRHVNGKIVKIGNSRGIRIPRTLLEQAGLTDEVEMTVEGNSLVIRSTHSPRKGWDVLFASMAQNRDDKLVDEVTPTQWDEAGWAW